MTIADMSADDQDWAKRIGLGKRDESSFSDQDPGDDLGSMESSGELPSDNELPPSLPQKQQDRGAVWICLDCYTVDAPIRKDRADGYTTFVIFACGALALLLGVFVSTLLLGQSLIIGSILFAYEGWRTGQTVLRCRHCGSERVIPPDSPRGRQLQGLE